MPKAFALIALLSLTGCMTTDKALENTDYACIRVNVDGPTTDSSAAAQGIKVPDGVELTPELLDLMCP
jgi:hypothetical protein